MVNKEIWIDEFLNSLKDAKLERTLGVFPGISCSNKPSYNFSSNDYLNLSSHPQLLGAVANSQQVGAGASRLISGTNKLHLELEASLARLLKKDAALVFGSGYLANLGFLSSYLRREDSVFSDRLIHASLIDGIRLSGAKHHRFQHNDPNHLRELLSKHHRQRRSGAQTLIVIESVYSMDGDLAPLSDYVELSKEFESHLFVDEAHALGVFGPAGAGLAAELGLENDIAVFSATLSKAFGSYGGFVCSSEPVQKLLINRSRPFIYNTALPPPLASAALESLAIISGEPEMGSRLLFLAECFRALLQELGFPIGKTKSQIIPLIIGDNQRALELAERLQKRGIFVKAIRSPTVPKGSARLRFSLTLAHNEAVLAETAFAAAEEAKRIGVIS